MGGNEKTGSLIYLVGADHPKWKGGRHLTAKGYVRVSAGKDRSKYAHRLVSEEIWGGPLPEGWEVHHMNFKRNDNRVGCWRCGHPGNLLLLSKELHSRVRLKRFNNPAARQACLVAWIVERMDWGSLPLKYLLTTGQ